MGFVIKITRFGHFANHSERLPIEVDQMDFFIDFFTDVFILSF